MRVVGYSRCDKVTLIYAEVCLPGQRRCNFNLIARYFGRAYTYTYKVRRDETKPCLIKAPSGLASLTSSLVSPRLARKDRGGGFSGALSWEIILRTLPLPPQFSHGGTSTNSSYDRAIFLFFIFQRANSPILLFYFKQIKKY